MFDCCMKVWPNAPSFRTIMSTFAPYSAAVGRSPMVMRKAPSPASATTSRCGNSILATMAVGSGLALGDVVDQRLVPRPLVAPQALQQRGEEELGVRHALVLSLVTRFR